MQVLKKPMSDEIRQLIKETHKFRSKNATYHRLYEVEVFVKDPLPENIDLNNVFSFLNRRIPSYMLNLIDVVYIGQFDDFEDRGINAKYADGALYVTNEQENDEDMIDDMVHEVAHALEETYGQDIYEDGSIEREFLGKRTRLERILGYLEHDTESYNFEKTDYDLKFDFFLHREIGYDIIEPLIIGLFVEPYAATSLREYFATGFEDYYLNNGEYIKTMSPALYKALDELNNLE
tara:strand:- start:2111 stop:2815 length:705 start_codon:yes stop_codon:yes gene_type:complete